MIDLPKVDQNTTWPAAEWTEGAPASDVDADALTRLLDHGFASPQPASLDAQHGFVAIHRGRLVAERYGSEQDATTPLISWSMAKSVLHAVVGILVRDGALDVKAPASVPAWAGEGTKTAITLDDLLRMVSGLRFAEDYVDAETSDCIEMLFGSGKDDVAAYAEALPLDHAPGRVFNYSSGTSNIVSAICARAIGGGTETFEAFVRRELLDPIGMKSSVLRFDTAGTWIGSSFVLATARDFARFGLLYLRDGVWEGRAILPKGWVDAARTPTPASQRTYGAHWWLAQNGTGTFCASGYRGQFIAVVPARDLVLVRLGATEPTQRGAVYEWLDAICRCFPSD